ncbi:uncharacterized protein GGS22DRAFT_173695 [Annulohypoxylon maeteangense]|uniref:uncharacterized protein n=1 Tax=Annulohypoxylon maeteangense TaxID=1927788 RepID=UPI0020085C3C|nr:uncharacterized protein GGS22DRAFT_173695 [Annulohypoxylon maeteangense]KAI0880882.1 hypothetical protein GGS22DRAFT_173695 [Annulohypoxylon maeteangense]
MAPVTEFVFSTLKPTSSPESINPIFATLKSQPGNQAVRSSPTTEDPSQIRLLIDWDAISSHFAFRATDGYKAYLSSLAPHATAPSKILHAELTPFPPVVLDKSPVTEVLLVYFSPDADEVATLALAKVLAEKLTAADIAGTTGLSAVGWSVEKDVVFKGEKTRALVVLLGWESVQAHETARDTDAFKVAITEFHDAAKGLKGFEIEHISAKAL